MHIVYGDMPLNSLQLNPLFRATFFWLVENLKKPVDGYCYRLELLIDAVQGREWTDEFAQDKDKCCQLSGSDDAGEDEIATDAEHDERGYRLNGANKKIGFGAEQGALKREPVGLDNELLDEACEAMFCRQRLDGFQAGQPFIHRTIHDGVALQHLTADLAYSAIKIEVCSQIERGDT